MPLFKTIEVNSQTIVKIWKIEESFDELMSQIVLRSESEIRVLGMKSDIHRRGFLSIRMLLKEFGYQDSDLYYDEIGRPHLKDGKHISITHSFSFSAIILSESVVGIDVEMQRDKIKLIAHKFIDYEFDYLDDSSENYVKYLTILWCVKESLYKLYKTPGLSFKNHCLVIPFSTNEAVSSAWIDYEGIKTKYEVHTLEFEEFTCAYALA